MPVLCAPGLETDFAFRVVLLDEILQNSARLPECEAVVGVLDRGHAAVGVDGEELGPFYVGEADVFDVVGEAELDGEHADFWGVRTPSGWRERLLACILNVVCM